MHVVLKPFIKLFLLIAVIMGVAKFAGVDVESLVNDAGKTLEDLTSQQSAEE